MLPVLVQAAAQSIQGSNLTVLNGASGINDVATGLVAQGMSIYESLRRAMTDDSTSIGGAGAHNGDGAAQRAPAPTGDQASSV